MAKQKFKDVEKKVLGRVTPSQSDRSRLEKVIEELKDRVGEELKSRGLSASIELVGSIAKDTFLRENLDVDLFVSFPTGFSKEDIGSIALSIGRKILRDTEECYAEHPYIRGFYHGERVEIVPCYKIESASQKLSAVDRTPLHTEYVKEHLQESQKQEVRLFKQFLRGIGCYGAEAEVEGFSGYLCEILVIKYGSFRDLLQRARKWKPGEKLALSEDGYPVFDTPLVFIDPVDSDRNVASALSNEKFDLFVKACGEYLKNPSMCFFFPNKVKPWSLEKIRSEIEKEGFLYVGVKVVKPDIIDENLYPQIRKAVRSIRDVCERNGFTVYDAVFHVDTGEDVVLVVVKTGVEPLSETFVHVGPPVRLKKNGEEFVRKWEDDPRVTKGPYRRDGRFYVELKRDYVDIRDFLEDKVKDLGMGRHLDSVRDKNFEIVGLDGLLKEGLRVFWTVYLDGKLPWER